MTVPASLSQATGEDLLFGMTISAVTTGAGDKKEGSGSVEPEDPPASASTPTSSTGPSAANANANANSKSAATCGNGQTPDVKRRTARWCC